MVGKLVLQLGSSMAALSTEFVGSGEAWRWASGVAVLSGALAAPVNTMEHEFSSILRNLELGFVGAADS
jgi:hypothetical protein